MKEGTSKHYRPEIDALRALAVTAVILFHAGVSFVPDGFRGVDVFYVISGYLITGILVREMHKFISQDRVHLTPAGAQFIGTQLFRDPRLGILKRATSPAPLVANGKLASAINPRFRSAIPKDAER